MKWLVSSASSIFAASAGRTKLGQPQPESNLSSLLKSCSPHATQRYVPPSWQSQYSPVKARSVPLRRVTSYCCGVS
jgi:hypothetical protein